MSFINTPPPAETPSVAIIGGGIGGLFTGALLAKNGCRVTVLEKNIIIGGGLQCFKRGDSVFETGMHVLGGFQEGGSIKRILSYLGIYDKLRIRSVDADCIDSIYFASDGITYSIPHGREPFEKYLIKTFPSEAKGITEYVKAIYALTGEIDLFNLRPSSHDMFAYNPSLFVPADQFIEKFTLNSKLQALLAYMNPLYGGIKGHTPAYIHAIINVLYIEGSHFFEGGGQQLADKLCEVITSAGGAVHTDDAVDKIVCCQRKVMKLVTRKGKEYTADYYVSAIHPQLLVDIIEGESFSPAYKKRLKSIPNTYSAFTLYIRLKENTQPYVNHPCYFVDDYSSVWGMQKSDEQWPKGFMCFTPPEENQGPWAKRIIVSCLIESEAVQPWADSSLGHRPQGYVDWKRDMQEKVLARLNEYIPGIRESIADIYTSSPLTIRDYYGTPGGALYGYRIDSDNPALAQVPVVTKVSNLFLTGQNMNLHGICGVPLTAITTAEAILGQNSILPFL